MSLSRRRFLSGASSLAISAWSFDLAIAGINNPGSGAAAPSAPTGKFIQVAAGAASVTGNEYPFINFMKTWAFTQVSDYTTFVGTLNDDGYPQTSPTHNYFGGINIPTSLTGVGTSWVMKWTGKSGDSSNNTGMGFSTLGGSVVSGGAFVSGPTTGGFNFVGTNGRVVFTFNQSSQLQVIFSLPATMVLDGTLANIVLCPLTQEAAFDAGEIFNSTYIASMRALNPRALRVVNWNAVNSPSGSQLTQLAGAMPATALTYWPRFVPGFWCGSASGTNTYTVTAGSGISSIVDGTTVHCVFTNSGSISGVTLAISGKTDPFGTTNIPILDLGCGALQTNAVNAGAIWTLIYDAGMKAWLGVIGGQGNRDGIQIGVPLSVQIALCNKLNIDLYLNLPHHATDALITSWATTIKNTLNSNLTCWYEISDEIWNFGYTSTAWFRARGTVLGWANTFNNQAMFSFYGLKFRQWSALIKTAYGAQTNYKRLLNFQAFGDLSIQQFLLEGQAIGPQALTITSISASATTPTVTGSTAVKYLDGQQVRLTVSGTGAIGALNGTTAYVSSPSGSTFLLSSTPYPTFTPISTAGGTFSSGSSQTLYSANGGTDYSSFPNRPVDWADAISYATYYYGAQLRWVNNPAPDGGYTETEGGFAINAGTLAASVQLQTSLAHGYTTGQRVQLNGFTGTGWLGLNGQSAFVTVVDATHFTVPINSSGFPAYSGNGGNVSRYADAMAGLVTAGANYASGVPASMASAIAWLDGDIRAGTNYTSTVAHECISSLNSTANGGAGIYPIWEGVAASYDAARTGAGMPLLQIICYEGGMQGLIPAISLLTQLGRTTSSSCTFNIGNVQAVHQVAHGYQNGFRISLPSGSLPTGGQINSFTDYFVTGATADDYGISASYHNVSAITATGTAGTATVVADTNGLDNLLDAYKHSSTFQATVKFQLDQFFASGPHAYLGAWYEMAIEDNWSLYPFDIYGTPFTSWNALAAYHYP